jgi:hypothetical protein
LLHDRSIPGSRSNIDHLAVVPSGVWVIDTKRYTGRVQRRNVGWWLTSRLLLVVNGRDRTPLVQGVLRQMARVSENVGNGVSPSIRDQFARWPHNSRWHSRVIPRSRRADTPRRRADAVGAAVPAPLLGSHP